MSSADFRALIPHQGGMCLLERVLRWDEKTIELATATHRDAANPLRVEGRLRAIHLCEYGAQAMAVHGALLAQTSGGRAAPGVLVSLREVALAVDYLDELGGELLVNAECLHAGAGSMQYRFVIRHDQQVIATGRAAVITSGQETPGSRLSPATVRRNG